MNQNGRAGIVAKAMPCPRRKKERKIKEKELKKFKNNLMAGLILGKVLSFFCILNKNRRSEIRSVL